MGLFGYRKPNSVAKPVGVGYFIPYSHALKIRKIVNNGIIDPKLERRELQIRTSLHCHHSANIE